MNDAAVAPQKTLQQYVLRSAKSLGRVGLKFQVSSFGPCLYNIFRGFGGAVGAPTTHIADIFGRGTPDI